MEDGRARLNQNRVECNKRFDFVISKIVGSLDLLVCRASRIDRHGKSVGGDRLASSQASSERVLQAAIVGLGV